jgi:hypothetical protein
MGKHTLLREAERIRVPLPPAIITEQILCFNSISLMSAAALIKKTECLALYNNHPAGSMHPDKITLRQNRLVNLLPAAEGYRSFKIAYGIGRPNIINGGNAPAFVSALSIRSFGPIS